MWGYFNFLESIHFEGRWMLAQEAWREERCLEAWLIIISQPQGGLTASKQPMRGDYNRNWPISSHLLWTAQLGGWCWRGSRLWMGLATEFMGWLSVIMPGAADSGSCTLYKSTFVSSGSGIASTSWDAWGPGVVGWDIDIPLSSGNATCNFVVQRPLNFLPSSKLYFLQVSITVQYLPRLGRPLSFWSHKPTSKAAEHIK